MSSKQRPRNSSSVRAHLMRLLWKSSSSSASPWSFPSAARISTSRSRPAFISSHNEPTNAARRVSKRISTLAPVAPRLRTAGNAVGRVVTDSSPKRRPNAGSKMACMCLMALASTESFRPDDQISRSSSSPAAIAMGARSAADVGGRNVTASAATASIRVLCGDLRSKSWITLMRVNHSRLVPSVLGKAAASQSFLDHPVCVIVIVLLIVDPSSW